MLCLGLSAGSEFESDQRVSPFFGSPGLLLEALSNPDFSDVRVLGWCRQSELAVLPGQPLSDVCLVDCSGCYHRRMQD